MATTTKFPRTNQELYDLGGGESVRFPGTEEEYLDTNNEIHGNR